MVSADKRLLSGAKLDIILLKRVCGACILMFFRLILQLENMQRPPLSAVIIGTGFGTGFSPVAPGTAGALAATMVWYVASMFCDSSVLTAATLAFIIVFTLLGTWSANRLAPYWGDDPSRVVIDEWIGVAVPLTIVPCAEILWAALAFALFRFFDILKPLGIRSLDNLKGGFWVMADDILAGVYSLIVILLLQWVV